MMPSQWMKPIQTCQLYTPFNPSFLQPPSHSFNSTSTPLTKANHQTCRPPGLIPPTPCRKVCTITSRFHLGSRLTPFCTGNLKLSRAMKIECPQSEERANLIKTLIWTRIGNLRSWQPSLKSIWTQLSPIGRRPPKSSVVGRSWWTLTAKLSSLRSAYSQQMPALVKEVKVGREKERALSRRRHKAYTRRWWFKRTK